jgi:hypothetical protein
MARFDVNTGFIKEEYEPLAEKHEEELNKPCNCAQCVVHALLYGVAKVKEVGGEWVPILVDDKTLGEGGKVHCISSPDMRYAAGRLDGVAEAIGSALLARKFRALTGPKAGSSYHAFIRIPGAQKRKRGESAVGDEEDDLEIEEDPHINVAASMMPIANEN